MTARQIMDSTFVALQLKDSIKVARSLMHELKTSEYPVMQAGQLLGFLHVQDLEDRDQEESLKSIKLHEPEWVTEEEGIRSIWAKLLDRQISCLAVGSSAKKLSGIIRRPDVLKYTQMWLGSGNGHHLLILKIRKKEFTLANIMGISQDTECRLLGLISIESEDEEQLFLLVDVVCENLQSIVSAFIRYGIEIEQIQQEGEDEDLLTDRLDMLMNYLNV